MKLLLQPTASLPARHSMIASIQINVDHCRVWVFFNELGAVSQCPNNMEVSKAFHPKKIYISQVHHLPSPWVLNRNIKKYCFSLSQIAMPRNPSRRASKPHLRHASKPLGTKSETKIFEFRWFLGPSEQNELYHTPILSKIWDLSDRIFFGGGSL